MVIFCIPEIILIRIGQKLSQINMVVLSDSFYIILIARMLNARGNFSRTRIFRCADASIGTEPTDILIWATNVIFEEGNPGCQLSVVDFLLANCCIRKKQCGKT